MGTTEDFRNMIQFITQHKITPIIDKVFPLAQINDAITRMGQSQQFGKIVIDIP